MAKRKPMGAAATSLFQKRTGGDALASVLTSSDAPKGRAPSKGRKAKASSRAATSSADSARWTITTIRLTATHWRALRMAALERASERGSGKADASEVLREVLDEWMARR